MCRWMGSHFHGLIEYSGIAFSLELLDLLGLGDQKVQVHRDFKIGRFVLH